MALGRRQNPKLTRKSHRPDDVLANHSAQVELGRKRDHLLPFLLILDTVHVLGDLCSPLVRTNAAQPFALGASQLPECCREQQGCPGPPEEQGKSQLPTSLHPAQRGSTQA